MESQNRQGFVKITSRDGERGLKESYGGAKYTISYKIRTRGYEHKSSQKRELSMEVKFTNN